MNYLTYLPVWEKLSNAEQAALERAARRNAVARGTVLHGGASDCTGLILVIAGQLRVFTVSDDGREITLYRLFDRDICLFSASCMLRSIQFDMTVTAEKDTEILLIPSEVYHGIMQNSAVLANYTNEVMASRFSDVMWLIDQVMWKSFDKRLAEFLLNESAIEGSSVLSITHETIGNHLGSPREVVTRMLKYFVGEGLVELSRGTVKIVDERGLSNIAEG